MDRQEYKLEKLKLRVDQEKETARMLGDLLQNPLVEYALGLIFIAYLTKGTQSILEKATGVDLMATTYGMALAGFITAQQISKSMPYITDTALKLLPGLGVLK